MSAIDQPVRPTASPNNDDINADLGFGAVVARESRRRLLNRDGTFNVHREGLGFWHALSLYHYLLTITWPRFLTLVTATYVAANTFFALAYVACGPHALTGFDGKTAELRFARAFFFSVHTLATIGYGSITPVTLGANVVVTIESLVGLLGFAVVAGLVFARFARPTAQVIFSNVAVVAPYRGLTAFMFRIANQRSNELVELEAKVLLSMRRRDSGMNERDFHYLKLERDRVAFFPLSWTIVHPIDNTSPLFRMNDAELRERDAEFLVLLNGFDETFSQTVHTRSSYKPDEVKWNAKFRTILNIPRDGDDVITLDVRALHEYDELR